MSAQESLTFLFDAIALSFIAIAVIDLGREIVALYKQVFAVPQISSPANQLQPLPQLPDPWLTPVEAVAPAQITPARPKPMLLLAPVKVVDDAKLSDRQPTAKELLGDIDVDKVKLREARKIAKVLGIAQKVNGRDQNLTFLRGQIKLKLQQERSLSSEVVIVAKSELVAC